jgi:hypothetical protein
MNLNVKIDLVELRTYSTGTDRQSQEMTYRVGEDLQSRG